MHGKGKVLPALVGLTPAPPCRRALPVELYQGVCIRIRFLSTAICEKPLSREILFSQKSQTSAFLFHVLCIQCKGKTILSPHVSS